MSSLHLHTKSDHESVVHKCHICPYSSKQKCNLKKHIQSVHLKDSYYPCNLCDHQATRKEGLKDHVKRIHQGQENVACTDCNKIIKKSGLGRHRKLVHCNGQPKQNCNICPFQTKYSSSLKKHKLKIHQIKE